MTNLSIIIPVYNEKGNIDKVVSDIERQISSVTYEIIVVDDASTDGGCDFIDEQRFCGKAIQRITHSKKSGQTAALSTGAKAASSDVIATLDGDDQFDVKDIFAMYEIHLKTQKFVNGWRRQRQDPLILKKLPSFLANKLIGPLFNLQINDIGCPLRVMPKKLFLQFELSEGMHRFLPILAKIHGSQVIEYSVHHKQRTQGVSKYGLSRIFPVIRDLFFLYLQYKKKRF